MCDLLIPEEFNRALIPNHPAELGRWLRINQVPEEIIQIICDSNISGGDFETLTDRDLKDLIPQFLLRKKLRDWIASVMSGKVILMPLEDRSSTEPVESHPNGANESLEGGQHIEVAEEEDPDLEMVPPSEVSGLSSSVSKTISRAKKRPSTPLSQGLPGEKIPRLATSPSPCSTLSGGKVPRVTKTITPIQNALGTQDTSLASSVPSAASEDDTLESLTKRLNLVVPSSVKECRRKGDGTLTSKAENDMISHSLIILQATVGRDRPTKSEFELCAQRVIALVPEMKDPIPSINKSAFKQWNTVKVKLQKAFYNRKPVEKPRKKKNPETESTQQGHDEQLKIEMKAKKPDEKKIKGLLTVSLEKRREWIQSLTGKGTVKKVLEEYPGFKNYNQVMIEASLITKCDGYEQAWLELLPMLWQYTVTNCKDDLTAQGLDDKDLESMEDDEKTFLAISCLPSVWGLKDDFVKTAKETTTFSSYIKSLSSGDVHLVVPDNVEIEAPQVFIVIDNEVLMDAKSFRKGLFAFFCVHFVFNLEYPKKLKYCFMFIEEYIFGIQQKKKTMEYRKGVKKLLG